MPLPAVGMILPLIEECSTFKMGMGLQGISNGAEAGCGEGNSQMDKELRVVQCWRGSVQELATAWEWVGLVKRDMSVVE